MIERTSRRTDPAVKPAATRHSEADPAASRAAVSAVPLHPLLAQRWSPRGFDPTADISDAELLALLEAARWAPSAVNRQPWRFVVGRRGDGPQGRGSDPAYKALFDSLNPGNQVWASGASALVLAAVHTRDESGEQLSGTEYELGLAVAQLTVQAHAERLHVHQMGGFNRDATRAALDMPAGFEPVVVLAVGRLGSGEELPDQLRRRERAPRTRAPLADIAYADSWGTAFPPAA